MPPKKKMFGKPPVRLRLTTLDGDDTVAPLLTEHTTVVVPRGRTEHAFEWTRQQFFVLVAEDEDGSPCAVDKELRLR